MESHVEDIIKIIQQQKKNQQKNDINRGYAEVFYDDVTFFRKYFQKWSMMFPEILKEVKKENTKPDLIYTNQKQDIVMTYSFCEETKELLQLQYEMDEEIQSLYQNVCYKDCDILQTKQSLDIVRFSFEALEVWHILFLFLIQQELTFGIFRCPATQKRDWNDIVKQMLLSITIESWGIVCDKTTKY